MTIRLSDDVVDEICRRYQAGESSVELGQSFGVSDEVVRTRLKKRGVRVRASGERVIGFPDGALDMYLDGMPIAQVAKHFGMPRAQFDRLLRGAGIRPRPAIGHKRYIPESIFQRYVAGETGQNLAVELGISPVSFYARLRARGMLVRATHDYPPLPRIGRKRTDASMEAAALTREANCSNTSPAEDRFAAVLDELGIRYVRQKAIGRYNVDFALPDRNLVVEVTNAWHTSGKHPSGSRVEFEAKRREFLESRGWTYTEIAEPFGHLLHFAA